MQLCQSNSSPFVFENQKNIKWISISSSFEGYFTFEEITSQTFYLSPPNGRTSRDISNDRIARKDDNKEQVAEGVAIMLIQREIIEERPISDPARYPTQFV